MFAEVRLEANGDDAIAVMVVEKVREDLLAHAEGRVRAAALHGRFRQREADFRQLPKEIQLHSGPSVTDR
jgi:hypothetical protein